MAATTRSARTTEAPTSISPPGCVKSYDKHRRRDLKFGRPHSTVCRLNTLKKTPLNARHRALGARMVEFGGWDMPVEYSGIVDEHMAVRTRAGVFDVSHMGQIEIAGADALRAVQHITSNDVGKLSDNQIQYSAL